MLGAQPLTLGLLAISTILSPILSPIPYRPHSSGGTYVLMQYFSSKVSRTLSFLTHVFSVSSSLICQPHFLSKQRWISINWGAISNKYEKFVDTASGPADPAGNALTNSRAARIWQRLVDFLTAGE